MRQSCSGRFRQQVGFLRRQFLQGGGLPFADVLSADLVAQALTAIGGVWYDRIYSPLVTLWVFLGQVLSPDQSCRAAVARLNAHRAARGQRPCSARTGAYCQARQRLPERFVADVARRTGRALDDRVGPEVAVEGPAGVRLRRVARVHARHAGEPGRVPAAGHPEAGPRASRWPASRPSSRWPAGRSLDLGICRYAGKGQSELGMLRDPVGPVPPRRRRAGRPADVRLDRDGHAQAARGRLACAASRPTGRPTSAGASGWARATTSSRGPSREAPVDRPGGLRPRCRSP